MVMNKEKKCHFLDDTDDSQVRATNELSPIITILIQCVRINTSVYNDLLINFYNSNVH